MSSSPPSPIMLKTIASPVKWKCGRPKMKTKRNQCCRPRWPAGLRRPPPAAGTTIRYLPSMTVWCLPSPATPASRGFLGGITRARPNGPELDFPQATEVSKVRVFWFADRPVNGGCDVPQNWLLLYKDGKDWKPVDDPSGYGVVPDCFNDTTFAWIKTRALRIKAQLKPGWSGGICEWEVE